MSVVESKDLMLDWKEFIAKVKPSKVWTNRVADVDTFDFDDDEDNYISGPGTDHDEES